MRGRYQKGGLYKIRFHDHCCGMKESVICEFVGWVLKETKDNLVLTAWKVDTNDQEIHDNNVEPVTLVKSCIIRRRKLG